MSRRLLGVAVLAVLAASGCGSSSKRASPQPSSSTPKAAVEHPCQDSTVAVQLGRQLDFSSCGAGATATLTDPNKVLSSLGPLMFIARAAGQATIDVTRVPACSPGEACSQAREQVARIVVNVS